MAFHLKRNVLLWCIILLICFYLELIHAENAVPTADSNEDGESSSEETVEDSNETIAGVKEQQLQQQQQERGRRRRRSMESTSQDGMKKTPIPRIGIPGLPDPATILKVAEILQAVGEQVLPILLQGIVPSNTNNFVGERITRLSNLKFLRNFKNEIDEFSNE